MKEIVVNEDEALTRYLELTAINGGSGNERDVAARIVDSLIQAGLDESAIRYDGAETRTRISGNCSNVVVHLPGSDKGPRTMLSAHMDTVPICLGSDPVVDGDQVYSRGETGLGADNRSGCAAILTAAVERLRLGRTDLPPVVIVFLIQEEIGLEGARHLDPALIGHVDRAFNFDGGAIEKVTTGAIGGERAEITLTGIPAHAGAAPEKGASAIVMAAKAIADLDARGWLGRIEQQGGSGTANVGVIQGGDATNVVTPRVTLRAEARSHDAAFRTEIISQMRAAFESAAASTANIDGNCGKCEFNSRVDYEAFCLADDDPSVELLEQALQSIGRQPYRQVAGGGLDANWLKVHGINAVTVGCGQENIHTADERLNIPDYLAACRVATMLICQAND
ncbi:Carboxypeptidase G2 precursor [Stieleria maiorica]|uniref:Carboxypeptidase G2 n=1 Tax=Stieleria maiorica TaxID=2795974 RepID=A0A5B9MCV7_9BACT|nr:M20/M25/M40 family metallo-hydrolase [Stieleria maiorica]QEF99082.1 Carboxypeptidase G2 precursor [Stieleria maiorica]